MADVLTRSRIGRILEKLIEIAAIKIALIMAALELRWLGTKGRSNDPSFPQKSEHLVRKSDALGCRRNARSEVSAIIDITGIRKKKPGKSWILLPGSFYGVFEVVACGRAFARRRHSFSHRIYLIGRVLARLIEIMANMSKLPLRATHQDHRNKLGLQVALGCPSLENLRISG
jgi:hypothetical protein